MFSPSCRTLTTAKNLVIRIIYIFSWLQFPHNVNYAGIQVRKQDASALTQAIVLCKPDPTRSNAHSAHAYEMYGGSQTTIQTG